MSTQQRTVLWPTLSYRDARAAIAFLVEAFGFREVAVYAGQTDDVVAHAELAWPGGGGVMLGSADGTGSVELPPGTGSVYVVVDGGVDELFARAVAAGATVVREPRDEDYGGRDFIVRDPEGVHWSFGTYAGADAT